MTAQLLVTTVHRPDCTFGPGMYRITFGNQTRYCQDQAEVERAHALLAGVAKELRVERDGHCLDGDRRGDARTPDVVDAEWWLGLPVAEGMRELGLDKEADYRRAYRSIESVVLRRDNRASQSGVRASIVIKRKGAKVVDA